MTHRRGRIGRLGAAVSTAALAVGLAGGPALADPVSEGAFHGAYPMAESELSDLRGGFVLPDTLLYFTINAQSQIIDNVTGDLLDGGFDITLDTRLGIPTDLPDNVLVDANGVVTALTVGGGNSAADINSLADFTGLLAVIQNTQDNVTVQQLTEMTIGLDAQALAANASGLNALAQQMQDIALIQIP